MPEELLQWVFGPSREIYLAVRAGGASSTGSQLLNIYINTITSVWKQHTKTWTEWSFVAWRRWPSPDACCSPSPNSLSMGSVGISSGFMFTATLIFMTKKTQLWEIRKTCRYKICIDLGYIHIHFLKALLKPSDSILLGLDHTIHQTRRRAITVRFHNYLILMTKTQLQAIWKTGISLGHNLGIRSIFP